MEKKRLGDYELVKEIGAGSMGRVYFAEHVFMKKAFALKILPPELSNNRAFMQRFEEEVAAIATLDHPSIVKIHNVSFAEGQYFLVMDCIVDQMGETTNLTQFLLSQGKNISEKEIFSILRQVASALDYAHQKKVAGKPFVHRSLKPNNILIGKRDESGLKVYLSDFGLTRIIGAGAVLSRTFQAVAESLQIATVTQELKNGYAKEGSDLPKLTPLHNSFVQNYAFLAPEQKRLEGPVEVDHRADSYAFGVLAYFLLSRSYPEGVFSLPSELGQNLQYSWDQLVLQTLQQDPQKRPEQLVSCLEAVQEEQSEALESLVKKAQVKVEKKELASVGATQSSGELRPVIHTSEIDRPEVDLDPAAAFNVDSTVKVYSPAEKEVQNIQPMMSEMVVIEKTTFARGADDENRDEMPRHMVSLSSFAIDVHPVTNEQFTLFLEAMGGEKDTNHNDIIRLKESRLKRSAGKISVESGYQKHPVVGVTWYGAVAYARWVGKRLPTEAEWECAAKGGDDAALYPTGNEIEKSQCNFFSSDTTSVMSYQPNSYGLYDMAGNVYEWCQDWYGYNYYDTSLQEPENPKGPVQGVYRVLRGGCWKSLKEDLRCSRRHRNNPGTLNSTYGFRCAADVQ